MASSTLPVLGRGTSLGSGPVKILIGLLGALWFSGTVSTWDVVVVSGLVMMSRLDFLGKLLVFQAASGGLLACQVNARIIP